MNIAQVLRMIKLLERDLQGVQAAADADDFPELEHQVKKFDLRRRQYLAAGGWKNERFQQVMRAYREAGSRVLNRATIRQTGYLRSFGYDGDSTRLTRKEAGLLIDGIKEMLAREQATTAVLAQLQQYGAVSVEGLQSYGVHRILATLEELKLQESYATTTEP